MYKSIIFILLISLVAAGCDSWDAKAPPETQFDEPVISIPTSYAHVPLSVRTSLIEEAVLQKAATSPIFSGQTDEISADIGAEEDIPAVIKQVVVTPFKAAGCAVKQVASTCPRQIEKRIKSRCFKKFRIWDCFRTITETVYAPCLRETTECWPEVKEVLESQIVVPATVKDRLLPTSVRLKYQGWLRHFDVEAQGRELSVTGVVDTSVSVDIKQGLLGASMKVKGALKCDAKLGLSMTVRTTILDDASVDLDITRLDLDAKHLCIPGAVQLAELSMLSTGIFLHKELLTEVLKKPFLKVLNEQLDKQISDDLKFGDRLQELARSISRPIDLKNDAWLRVNAQSLMTEQFSGTGSGQSNILALNASIEVKPEIVLGTRPADPPPGTRLAFSLRDQLPTGITLAARASVPLEAVRKRLTEELSAYVESKHPEQPYTVADVGLYQSADKFVFSLTVAKRNGGEVVGVIYAWATPYLDTENQKLAVRNVGFDVDSERVLAKVANWLLSSRIEREIEEKAAWEYGGDLKRLQNDLASIESDSSSGSFKGVVDEIAPLAIWVGGDAINVLATATGKGSFEFKPKL